jgi:hypothetical protein
MHCIEQKIDQLLVVGALPRRREQFDAHESNLERIAAPPSRKVVASGAAAELALK